LIEEVLPNKLNFKSDSIIVEFGGKLLYENSADMSEDELDRNSRRLDKSLHVSNLLPFSILYIQVSFGEPTVDAHLYLQILEDPNHAEAWSVQMIKEGVP